MLVKTNTRPTVVHNNLAHVSRYLRLTLILYMSLLLQCTDAFLLVNTNLTQSQIYFRGWWNEYSCHLCVMPSCKPNLLQDNYKVDSLAASCSSKRTTHVHHSPSTINFSLNWLSLGPATMVMLRAKSVSDLVWGSYYSRTLFLKS